MTLEELRNHVMSMDHFETAARKAGWYVSDSGAYLMAPIAYDALKGSVQHYIDGHAFLDRFEGDWEYACEVSGVL